VTNLEKEIGVTISKVVTHENCVGVNASGDAGWQVA